MKQLTQNEFRKGAKNYKNIASPEQDLDHEQIKFMALDEFGNLQYSSDGSTYETIQNDGKVKPLTSLTPITDESELPEGSEGDAYVVLTNGNLPMYYYEYTTEWVKTANCSDNTLYFYNNLLYIYNSGFNGYFKKTSYTDTAELTNGADFVNSTQLGAVQNDVTNLQNNKVDKTTASNKVYATSSQGVQTTINYGVGSLLTSMEGNYLVQRNVVGQIYVPETPTVDGHAASKKYIDTQVDTKQDTLSQTQLDAVNSGINSTKVGQITTNANDIASLQTSVSGKVDKTTDSYKVYATGSQGVQTTVNYGTGDIFPSTQSGYLVQRHSGGQIYVPQTPTSANHATSKKYVEDFVNSSINAFASFYITKNAQGDPFATKAELTGATTFYSGGVARTPTTNDYCIVLADESKTSGGVDPSTRYTYQGGTYPNGQWEYQYTINVTPLTSAQLQALNSGITSALVTQIGTNASDIANKQDTLVSGTTIKTINGNSLLGSGDLTIQAGQSVDVQVDGTSIVSNDVANLQTINGDYDATTNPLATQNDLSNIDLSTKMDKANPTGTGSLSVNRKANTTVGTDSVALANGTATGQQSIAVGQSANASGHYSVALGYNARSTANYSCAINNAIASGNYSFAVGNGATASGQASFATGTGTTASGWNASALGTSTTAQRKAQHTFGEWNILDTAGANETERGTYVEIVGNGTQYNNRSNARTLDWSGNQELAGKSKSNGVENTGDYKIGSSNTTIASVSGTDLTLGNSSLATDIAGSGTRPTYNSQSLALYNDIPPIPVTDVQLNGTSVVSSGVANVKALPNYSLSIGSTNGGNPRQVLFCSVNYTNFDSNGGAYFKLGAMSGHGNGSSYKFVEDIFINVNYQGTVAVDVYKYVQASVTIDGENKNYGDVFWTIDTTNKIVYFYILLGQYSSAQFTPGTKIGAAKDVTTANGIVQYTGTPTYYSSGTKTWADGNDTTYARKDDGLSYVTTAPSAANTDGLKIAVLSSEPATKYSGWLYFITE